MFIAGHQLSLKVEGVVQQSARVHRRVNKVKLKISANDPPLLSLEEVVEPKNDYFSAEFLVSLPTAGKYRRLRDTRYARGSSTKIIIPVRSSSNWDVFSMVPLIRRSILYYNRHCCSGRSTGRLDNGSQGGFHGENARGLDIQTTLFAKSLKSSCTTI